MFFINNITPALIYGTSFALGVGAAFFYPAKMAAIQNVVESSQLKFANALNSSVGAIALLFGAFCANFVILSGVELSFLIVAGMYLAGYILTGSINFIYP